MPIKNSEDSSKHVPVLMVILAFAIVYIVWGSTYYFIQQALVAFPPFILGAARFIIAGLLMMAWCVIKKEKIFDLKVLPHVALGGVLMLFVGNGMVIWVEQTLPSALAAIMVSSTPIWFVILDRRSWMVNFRNPYTIVGIVLGFIGVLLLFGERIVNSDASLNSRQEIIGLALLNVGVISWAGGSLYVKYKVKNISALVNTSWQILAAGVAFVPGIFLLDEFERFQWSQVSTWAWISLWYLVLMGSIVAFSAYVWLLQVRPAAQVSTYAYVNPVVAVILGVAFAGEKITLAPLAGLAIILVSVVLLNRQASQAKPK